VRDPRRLAADHPQIGTHSGKGSGIVFRRDVMGAGSADERGRREGALGNVFHGASLSSEESF
jgi:hypothetical protein